MPPDYAEAKRIFLEAAARNGAERARYLDETCGGDAALRAEVEALLAADAGPARALDQPVSISGFTILRRIGEGGMGTVYEAQQMSPRRPVALKLLKRGLSDPERLRRFRYETEILGRLDHPGIARIYAAGVEDGQPWFAMELVRGSPLLDHARRLEPPDRLALVARICEAVEHAHRKGIVHRDLKPGNILVDARGEPRLLDFGVAKAVGPDQAVTTLATRPGEILGTVPYMSPEQVRGDPDAVDARADVYALGGIAYELLAGRLPLDLERKPLTEALRTVLEQEPVTLGALDARWRGDVETIVAKALAKDPERRYASAGEMGADIGRFLRDEPILARPPSSIYQMRKFARRHRALVGGVTATILALVAGIVATALYAVEAGKQRVRFERERDEARRQEARASEAVEAQRRKVATTEETLRFVIDVLYSGDPKHGPDLPSFSGILDRAAARALAFEGDPEVQRTLAHVVGFVLNNVGRYEKARALFERALEKARVIGDPKWIVHDLAHLAGTLTELGEWDTARTLLDEALPMARANGDPAMLAFCLSKRAKLALKEQDLDAAERCNREVLEVATLEDVRLDADLQLSAICLAREDLKGAEEHTRSAEERATKLYAPKDPRIGPILSQRAQLLARLGRCEEAAETYTRLIAAEKERLGPTHPGIFALRTNHALALHRAGHPGDAAKELAAILADAEAALGPESPDVWQIRYCLVSAREAAKDLDGLEPLARSVVGFLRARVGVRNSRTLDALQIWGHALGHAGDVGAAADAYAEAARGSEGVPGLSADFAVICFHNAAEHYLAADRAAEALGAAREWVARQPCADAFDCIARALLRTGDAAGAESAARKARQLYAEKGADTSAVDALLAEIGGKR